MKLSHRTKQLHFAKLALFSALALGTVSLLPQEAQARVFVSVNIAPPVLPIYEQPPIPGPGYIWTPGYWAYDDVDGYYWVPGTWVMPPYVGALWTPGYWGWSDGAYAFHAGYWGHHVGYYGGIDYGFGYAGIGYVGGYWGPRGFYYNREVNHITNVHITNVYSKAVANSHFSRASFNGPGGISARPTAQQVAFQRESHTPPIAAQVQHQAMARRTESLRASVNHGTPSIAATATPTAFSARAAAQARGAGTAGATREHQPMRTSQTANRANSIARSTAPSSMRSSAYAPHAHVAARTAVARTNVNRPSEHVTSPVRTQASTRTTARTANRHENFTAHTANVSRGRALSNSQPHRMAAASTRSMNTRPAPVSRVNTAPHENAASMASHRAPVEHRAYATSHQPAQHEAPRAASRPSRENKPERHK